MLEDLREAEVLAPGSTQFIGQAYDRPGHGQDDQEEQEAKSKLEVVRDSCRSDEVAHALEAVLPASEQGNKAEQAVHCERHVRHICSIPFIYSHRDCFSSGVTSFVTVFPPCGIANEERG